MRENGGRTMNKKSTKILSCKPEDREEEVEDRREKKKEIETEREKGKTNQRFSCSNGEVISRV